MDNNIEFLEYDITKRDWRKISYSKLCKNLSTNRLCLKYIKDLDVLQSPYWIHSTKSGHLPDRVRAISQSIGDMLKMSDYPIAFYVKKKKSKDYIDEDLSKVKIKDLTLSPHFLARQIALSLFILSHYICDAHMPLHCDLRDYGKGNIRRINIAS